MIRIKCSITSLLVFPLLFLMISCGSETDTSIKLDAAAGVSFVDTDTDTEEAGGDVIISRAADESGITHYVLYWGDDIDSKLGNTEITSIAKTGSDLTYTFTDNTLIPIGATHLLVFTKNDEVQMINGVYVALDTTDQGASDWNTTIIDFTTATDARLDWIAPGETSSAYYYAEDDISDNGISTLEPDDSNLVSNLEDNDLFSFTINCGINPGLDYCYAYYDFPFAPLDGGAKTPVDLSQFSEIILHYRADADLKLVWHQAAENASAAYYCILKARADFGTQSCKLENSADGFKQPDWATTPANYDEFGFYFDKTEATSFSIGLTGGDDRGKSVNAEIKVIGFK